jgi:hypothetical protein
MGYHRLIIADGCIGLRVEGTYLLNPDWAIMIKGSYLKEEKIGKRRKYE